MGTIIDDVVAKLGGFDKLEPEEVKTYTEHLEILQGKSISVEDTKVFVRKMILNIERALVDTKEKSPESVGLKARLKNFLVLEAFLLSPEKAREALEQFYKQRVWNTPKAP